MLWWKASVSSRLLDDCIKFHDLLYGSLRLKAALCFGGDPNSQEGRTI